MVFILAVVLVVISGPAALESMRTGAAPDPSIGRAILIFVLLALVLSVRFQLILPVAAAETGGPIHIFRRSWELSAGHYWRLLGFLLLVCLVAVVVLLIAQIVGGILAKALFGEAKPLTVSALIVALITGVVQTAFMVIVSTMVARIYVQLAGRRHGCQQRHLRRAVSRQYAERARIGEAFDRALDTG